MGIEHIDVGAADVIGGSNALILRYCTGGATLQSHVHTTWPFSCITSS